MNSYTEIDLNKEYQLIQGFINIEDCPALCKATEKTIEIFYTEERLQNHTTFTAGHYGDTKSLKGRDSYAFMIGHSSGEIDSRLACIKFSALDPLIQKVSKLVEDKLEIKRGRYMLNVQRYYEDSPPLSLHYDHETYRIREIHGKPFPVLAEAIVPKKVAVLTLINNAIGGGTKISKKDKSNSMVVKYHCSDLLILNNTRILHGTDGFTGKKDREFPYVRYTMGWRAFDDNCCYFNIENDRPFISLPYEQIVEKHYDFIENKWQDLLEYWRVSGNTGRIMLY